MKKKGYFWGLCAAMIFSTIAVNAQNKPAGTKLEPLAADASLANTQSWLADALNQNNKVRDDQGTTYRLRSVKWAGCQMSFVQRTASTSAHSSIPARNFSHSAAPSEGVPSSPGADGGGGPSVSFDSSIIRDPLLNSQSRSSSHSEKIRLDFGLKSTDEPAALNSRTVAPRKFDGKVTTIVLGFRDTPRSYISNGKRVFMTSMPNIRNSFIRIRNEDALLTIAGFKHLASLCGK
jgi:hypothetical protein